MGGCTIAFGQGKSNCRQRTIPADPEMKGPREGGLVGVMAIAALLAWFAALWLIFGDML